MKLLLTSGGLRNDTITSALLDLVDIEAKNIKVAFIPTGMNYENGDKSWVISQLTKLQEIGVGQIDIVDISALSKDIWLPRLEDANVIYVNGGNTTELMRCFNESGLSAIIKDLLQERVYVGVSAGSYIATPDIRLNSDPNTNDEIVDGLNLVNFGLQAHYLSTTFPIAQTKELVQQRVQGCPYDVYALDDQMAIKVDGGSMEVLGEGQYELFKTS